MAILWDQFFAVGRSDLAYGLFEIPSFRRGPSRRSVWSGLCSLLGDLARLVGLETKVCSQEDLGLNRMKLMARLMGHLCELCSQLDFHLFGLSLGSNYGPSYG